MQTQIDDSIALLKHHLGSQLLAVHLYGSAVAGGLKPGSDIDLLVTVAKPLNEGVRRELMQALLRLSAWPATETLRPLEVTVLSLGAVRPWRYPAVRELQFGEWLREDLLAGNIEPATEDYDLALLVHQARQRSIALLGPAASELFEPVPEADLMRALHDSTAQWNHADDWLGDECNVALALARICLTLSTGEILAKDAAADWLLQRLPDEHRPLLRTARDVYLGRAIDDLGESPQAMARFVAHCRQRIERLRAQPGTR